MKPNFWCICLAGLALIASCKSGNKDTALQNEADSLQKQVIKIHDIAMPKSMKIPDLEKKVSRLLDSINMLPAEAKEAAADYREKLQSLQVDLSYANMAMDKWMVEFNLDSFKNNLEQRILYLKDEKMKAEKMKDAVLNSLLKADSLLKSKF